MANGYEKSLKSMVQRIWQAELYVNGSTMDSHGDQDSLAYILMVSRFTTGDIIQ